MLRACCLRSPAGALRRIVRVHFRWAPDEAVRWRLLSGELLRQPWALPVVMTEGPRWNTHATIGRIGPLLVRESLRLQTSQADAAARTWTIVMYTFPGHRTVASLGSPDESPPDGWQLLALPPGRYCLIARYYEPTPSAVLPAIEVDGAGRRICSGSGRHQRFLSRLGTSPPTVLAMLHYHAYVALKYRPWLPARWVEGMYLPVGNPETRFQYGALAANERLEIRVGQAARRSADVYVTVYNLASFPVASKTVGDECCRLGPLGGACTYLVRIHPRRNVPRLPDELDVTVLVDKPSQGHTN